MTFFNMIFKDTTKCDVTTEDDIKCFIIFYATCSNFFCLRCVKRESGLISYQS